MVGASGLALLSSPARTPHRDRGAARAALQRRSDRGPAGAGGRGGARAQPATLRQRALWWWCWQLCATVVVAVTVVVVNGPAAVGAGHWGPTGWGRVAVDLVVAWLLVRVAFRRRPTPAPRSQQPRRSHRQSPR